MVEINYKRPKVILFFKERVTDPLEGTKIINQKRLYTDESKVIAFIEKLEQLKKAGKRDVWDIGYKKIQKAEVKE